LQQGGFLASPRLVIKKSDKRKADGSCGFLVATPTASLTALKPLQEAGFTANPEPAVAIN